MATSRPHVVIFNPDSYRGDVLGHLGNAGAVTPNLDRLMNEGGVSYASAFAQNPVCTPSRCSFMTGWYPHAFGHRSMVHMLRPHEPHLLKVLMREGYHVWWGGKNDLVAVTSREEYLQHCHVKYRHEAWKGQRSGGISQDDPAWRVFHRGVFDGQGEHWPFVDGDCAKVRGAVDAIANISPDQPTCLFLPLANPHPAYGVEREFYDMIDPAKLPPRLPIPSRSFDGLDLLREAYMAKHVSEDAWRDIKRVYYAMCAKVDALFGQVVDALKAKGIYDDTLIVFMSDHGDFTGDYSLPEKTHFSLQDDLLRVPLVVKPPAGAACQPGMRRSLVELVDMCPTIYDLLGIQPGYTTQGMSLRQSLAGDDQPMRRCVFAQVGCRAGERAFLNTSSIMKRPATDFYYVQAHVSQSIHLRGSHALSVRSDRYKYVRRTYVDQHELYDLASDPGELNNLAGLPEYAQVQRQMESHLLDHLARTADVLRHDVDSRGV